MDEVRVIASQMDGAELRRERAKNRYYSRTDGTADDVEINEAIASAGGSRFLVSMSDEVYERIFGGKK